MTFVTFPMHSVARVTIVTFPIASVALVTIVTFPIASVALVTLVTFAMRSVARVTTITTATAIYVTPLSHRHPSPRGRGAGGEVCPLTQMALVTLVTAMTAIATGLTQVTFVTAMTAIATRSPSRRPPSLSGEGPGVRATNTDSNLPVLPLPLASVLSILYWL